MKIPKRKKHTLRLIVDIPTHNTCGKTIHLMCDSGEYAIKDEVLPVYDCGRVVSFRHVEHTIAARFTKRIKIGN